MKVSLFGTFDIANFGDVLFPYVTEAMLKARDPEVEIVRYSYRERRADSWFYDVRSIQSFPRAIAETDLVLIGGGHLIHADQYMAPGYGPTDPAIPHPFGFWWLPAVAGRMAGVPVALNAVSVSDQFPDWCRPLLSSFAESIDYAAVRDTLSQRRLQGWKPGLDVALVPDTIFAIDRLIERGKPSAVFEAFRRDHGLDRPYFIVQPSPSLRTELPVIHDLIAQAKARGWAVLELPIFQEKLNPVGVYRDVPGVTLTSYAPDPMLLAEVIANAEGVAGVSLHLTIVALVFGVPVYRKRYGAASKFVLLDGMDEIRFLDSKHPLGEAGAPSQRIRAFQSILDQHYDRLTALARAGAARERRDAAGWQLLAAAPDRMRKARSFSETLSAARIRARRLRNFAVANVMPLVAGASTRLGRSRHKA